MSSSNANLSDTNQDEWIFPLILSFLAGASTCLGAAIVFCFDAKQIEKSMTFSLSLAASVMITVSVISIGPECLEDVVTFHNNENENNSRQLVTIDFWLLVERFSSFGAGCFGYWLLSKALAAFPEPESFFVKNQQTNQSSPNSTNSGSSNNNNNKYPTTNENHDNMMDQEGSPEMASLIRRSTSGESNEHSSGSTTPRSSPTNSGNTPRTLSMRRTPSKILSIDVEEGGSNNDKYESKKDKEEASSRKRSWRVAMLLFFSLLFHNFPEGLAVAASTVESRQLGITVAIGILIHNIPEGIAIAVPCIAARPDMPWLAFWLASGSGLAEPLGAVFALFFLKSSKIQMENVLACVAGIMCTVAGVELYPEALRHVPYIGSNHNNNESPARKDYTQLIYGTVVGIAIMIATEWYL